MIKTSLRWLVDHLAGTYIALALLVLAGGTGLAATTSWDVQNLPQMNLDVSISSTQTTGIKLSALQRNGTSVTFPTTTGAVLRIRSGFRVEDIHYTSATVASDKVVTLVGVTRDICWNRASDIRGCGNGQSFSKGAVVELAVDSRLLNFKANKDRVNLLTGSGQIAGTGTGQSLVDLPCITTAQRDAFSYVTTGGEVICNSTLGVFQYRIGSNWIAFGSGTTTNASETVGGKTEMANGIEISMRTMTGGTTAPLAISPFYLLQNGSGSASAFKIPLTGANGAISVTLGGTGTGSLTDSGVLIGNHKDKFTQVQPGSSGNVLKSNGTSWISGGDPTNISVRLISGATVTTNTLADPQSATNFTQTGSITSTRLNQQGAVFHIHAGGVFGWGTDGNMVLSLKLGGTVVGTCSFLPTTNGTAWNVDWYITVRKIGASGVLQSSSFGVLGSGAGGKVCAGGNEQTTSFDTTTTKTVNVAANFSTVQAAHTINMENFIIFGGTPSP